MTAGGRTVEKLIIIPTYNERENIEPLLTTLLALLAAGVATGRRREPRAAAPGAAKPIAPAGAGA